MKRKDFLRKMRDRRRGDQLELREPEQRRAIDWRTLRLDLPAEGSSQLSIPVGEVALTPGGFTVAVSESCWVRGYRCWQTVEGTEKAEFQYRLAEDGVSAPTGAEALAAGDVWQP